MSSVNGSAAVCALVAVFVLADPLRAWSQASVSVGPPETLLTNQQMVELNLWAWPDGIVGVLASGDTYTFVGAQGGGTTCANPDGQPTRLVGSLQNPLRDGVTRCMAVGGMQRSHDYTGGGPIYTDPDTGNLLMFYHAENKTDAGFWTTLGMARSTDRGDSWTDLGRIVTANLPFARDAATDLGGGAYAIVNGYFYVYFRDFFPDGTQSFVSVARATYANVLEAASMGEVVPWTKYYQGTWSEPGLGGRSTNMEESQQHVSWRSVAWNTFLNEWIMVAMAVPIGHPGSTKLHLFESTDGLHWTKRQQLESDAGNSVYPTIVG